MKETERHLQLPLDELFPFPDPSACRKKLTRVVSHVLPGSWTRVVAAAFATEFSTEDFAGTSFDISKAAFVAGIH